MSSMSEEWRTLPFSNRDDGTPKLLFKFIISSDGFELYVTDILHCWRGSGDRTSIAREAARTHSSIDPNEDATQFQVLLSKLRDGLMGRNGGRCKIGSLPPDAADVEPRLGFTLHSRTPLPPPLQPLHWRFDLLQEERMLLTRELMLPALASELKRQTQIEDLKRRIEQKDHVITRLMDKIEQSSMDLSLVFPGYSSGRKGLSAKQATKVVPGISKFEEPAWEAAFGGDELTTTRTLAEAFRRPGTDRLWFEAPLGKYGEDAAWEAFGKAATYCDDWMNSGEPEPVFTEDEGSTDVGKGRNPRASAAVGSNGGGSAPGLITDESTEAFEDVTNTEKTWKGGMGSTGILQSVPRFSREESSSSDDPSPPVAKIGLVKAGNLGAGRSKNPPVSRHPLRTRRNSATTSESASDSSTPEDRPKRSSKLGTIGGTKKTSQATASHQPSSLTPTSSKTSTPSGKHGGGKKEHTLRSSSPELHQAETPTTQNTPSRKLGVLGGRHKPVTPQKTEVASKPASQRHTHYEDLDATDSPSSSPSPSVARPSQPSNKGDPIQKAPAELAEEPLTVEEIADRKREELKRTLNAGGGKKKRRKF